MGRVGSSVNLLILVLLHGGWSVWGRHTWWSVLQKLQTWYYLSKWLWNSFVRVVYLHFNWIPVKDANPSETHVDKRKPNLHISSVTYSTFSEVCCCIILWLYHSWIAFTPLFLFPATNVTVWPCTCMSWCLQLFRRWINSSSVKSKALLLYDKWYYSYTFLSSIMKPSSRDNFPIENLNLLVLWYLPGILQ